MILLLISCYMSLIEDKFKFRFCGKRRKILQRSDMIHVAAVKFGRMSKKQREKVEDEVRFHKAQMRAASETAPDSSVFEHQTPSSSDQHHPFNGG